MQYRDFSDVPRAIVVEVDGALYFLDCRFDDGADEYEQVYAVYRLPEGLGPELETRSWADLAHLGQRVGSIPTSAVAFDATRRASMRSAALEDLVA
jgi:hypothetical protein